MYFERPISLFQILKIFFEDLEEEAWSGVPLSHVGLSPVKDPRKIPRRQETTARRCMLRNGRVAEHTVIQPLPPLRGGGLWRAFGVARRSTVV